MKNFFTVAFLLCGICIPFQKSSAADKKWTVMAYMAADNNLEEYIVADFVEMAAAGSNKNMNIVVQLDRIPGYESGYGDWEICHRFYIEKGMEPLESNAIKDWGDGLGGGREVDMGDGNTLSAFIKWAAKNYPAENYVLILNDHGGGWRSKLALLRKALESATDDDERTSLLNEIRSIDQVPYKALCWDETTVNGTPIYMSELAQALTDAGVFINLFGFDACLMGMIEVAYQLYGFADIMVSSEDLIPGYGWDYTAILAYLGSSPKATAADLGKTIVESYDKYYSGINSTGYTLAAIDLYSFGLLCGKVDDLADSLIKNWNSDAKDIASKAKEVILEMNRIILAEAHGPNWENSAFGLSINFPTNGPDAEYTDDNSDFVRDTDWEDFLTEYNKSMKGSSIEEARKQLAVFGGDTNFVDLNKFCRLLDGASVFSLANGSLVSFDTWDVSPKLDSIGKNAKIWIRYNDPVNKSKTGLKVPVKLVAKTKDSVNPKYYAEFKKSIKLFDTKKYKDATGFDLVFGDMEIIDHLADGLYISYKDLGKNVSVEGAELAADVYIAAPQITSIEGVFTAGQPILVKGLYFGSKIPAQIMVEVQSKSDGKYKYVRCKPTKAGNYRFFDSRLKEGKSCMKVWEEDGAEEVGYSEVQVEYPKINPKYEPTGYICLYNLTGKCAGLIVAFDISGTITDQSGDPIPDVTVAISGNSGKTTTSSSDGSYNFKMLGKGDYTVTPQLDGYTFSPTSQNVTISDASQDNIDFIGTPGAGGTCTIAGWISASTEEPDIDLSGITVELSNGGGSTTTGSSGGYVFYDLNEGTYTVTPSRDGYSFSPSSRSVTLSSPNDSELNVNFEASSGGLPPGKFKISGSVTSEYVLSGCILSLSDGQSVPVTNNASDGKGYYEFTNLDPGTYTLSATCDGNFSWSGPGDIEITDADQTVNLQAYNQDELRYSVNITVSGLDPNDWIYIRTIFSFTAVSANSEGVVNTTWTKIPQGTLIVNPGSDEDKYVFSPSSLAVPISGDTSISFTATKN